MDKEETFEERSSALAAQLSEDLKDDIELQLDVREELHCHLLDAYDIALEHSDSEKEACEHTLKNSAPPLNYRKCLFKATSNACSSALASSGYSHTPLFPWSFFLL